MLKVTLIQATPDPINKIAEIASICYDSNPTNPSGLVNHLYKNGHHSVFEHIYFTFKIEGMSRACSHQLVRHRMCSFTQRSQRYCDEASTGFVMPMANSLKEYDILHQVCNTIDEGYRALQDLGMANEDARYLLPNATETEMYLSCNLRELIHLANERLCSRAQWEIRRVVKMMCKQVDEKLQFMLVPKCQSAFLKCPNPCREVKNNG